MSSIFDIVTLRPLHAWPGRLTPGPERRVPFKADPANTIRILKRELQHLEAKGKPVLEMAFLNGERDVRNDGFPRNGSKIIHPGVVLTIDCLYGVIRPYTDACRHELHNIRAIALHLEHLRLASLYGVGKAGQQYSGWKQLTGPPPEPEMTLDEAAGVISRFSKVYQSAEILAVVDRAESAFRIAARNTHPDLNGGKDDDFKLANKARAILARHHNPT
jgi:hypothetical protein